MKKLKKRLYMKAILMCFRDGSETCCNGNSRCCTGGSG